MPVRSEAGARLRIEAVVAVVAERIAELVASNGAASIDGGDNVMDLGTRATRRKPRLG
jgi:hypothetical protein